MSYPRIWKTLILVLVVLAVLLVAVLWILLSPSVKTGKPAFAPQGQVVSGFPKNLLLDNSLQVQQSYSIDYASNAGQYTVHWVSSSSPEGIALEYLSYFKNNGWNIINQSTSTPSLQSMYAVSASGTANFVATAGNGGSDVVLTYAPSPVATTSHISLPQGYPAFLVPSQFSSIISVQGNASSGTVTFDANATASAVRNNLVKAFQANQWKISKDQEASTSISLVASSTSYRASILLEPHAEGDTTVQVQYENMK